MPAAEPALPRPADARRPFATDEILRRVVRLADLERGAKVLELGIGDGRGTELLAGELGLDVLALDADGPKVAALQERTRKASRFSSSGKLELRTGNLGEAGLKPGAFSAVLVFDRDHLGFLDLLQQTRPLLAKSGKLCLTFPVKVGRFPPAAPLEYWERKLGQPLGYPRDLMGQMSANGFEPQWAETLSDGELDAFYSSVSEGAPDVREEAAVHAAQGGLSGVSFALMLGRRKESGEKPPLSRDRG